MRILFIEPTPSPNSMKINLDFRLPDGVRNTYTPDSKHAAPDYIRRLLDIPGVSGVFHTADFIAIDREPRADWQAILQEVRQSFREDTGNEASDPIAPVAEAAQQAVPSDRYGEASVFVQKFRGIPLQIRVRSEDQEERVAMQQRFIDAAMQAQYGSPNLIKERVLEDYGVRYGTRKEIAEQIVLELEAAYDDNRLHTLAEAALTNSTVEQTDLESTSYEDVKTKLGDPDWKVRYAALERMNPDLRMLPLIEQASRDDNFSIRRLATVYLGDLKEPIVFPHLYRMLRDPSASVRRTAGDCLSDIGDPDAIGPMCEALTDPAKIVRWRAARYLYETGDESALTALSAAADDPEFEVKMQIQFAIARIEGGEAAAGSVWQQMTRRDRI